MRGLSLVAASGGHSSSRCAGLSLSRPLSLRSTSSRRAGSVVVAHGPSCSAACRIFPDQGSNPCPLHWQADSQPLRHQGSPEFYFIYFFIQQALISYLLYTHQCIHVNPNLPIHPTTTNSATFPCRCPYVCSLHLCLCFKAGGFCQRFLNRTTPQMGPEPSRTSDGMQTHNLPAETAQLLSGLNEAQVLYISVQKEFNERQSDR